MILLLKVVLLDCDRIIDEESRGVSENIMDSVFGEVERDFIWNI